MRKVQDFDNISNAPIQLSKRSANFKISISASPQGSLCSAPRGTSGSRLEQCRSDSSSLAEGSKPLLNMLQCALFTSGILLLPTQSSRKCALHVNGNHKDFRPKLPPCSAHRKCDRINREFCTDATKVQKFLVMILFDGVTERSNMDKYLWNGNTCNCLRQDPNGQTSVDINHFGRVEPGWQTQKILLQSK